MVTVFVPLFIIIIMNTGIGIKICRYTGRRSGNRSATSVPADSAEEIYSNCSTTHKYAMDMRATATAGDEGNVGLTRAHVSASTAAITGNVTSWRVLTRRQHTQVRVTRALLVVSTVFVALNLPSYAFRIHLFIISIRDEAYFISFHAYIWQEFIQFLYYSNISSRFFLYLACSRNFRYAVRRLACRQRCRQAS